MQAIWPFIVLARPKHWLKNVLIFVPLLYAHKLFEPLLLRTTVLTFVTFCLLSSAVYVINDLADSARDRQHPVKSRRPIAAGQIRRGQAVCFAAALFAAGFALPFFGGGTDLILLFAACYVLLNLAYSFWLKHVAIVDCFCIAAGFVLRIYAGGAASGDAITEWLFLTMAAASLFMAFGKRCGEMLHVKDIDKTRTVLRRYNVGFLNGMIFVCAGLAIIFYALWAMANDVRMVYTVPFVIFIVCRYLLNLYSETSQGDPTSVILSDKVLLAAVGIFGVVSVALLYS